MTEKKKVKINEESEKFFEFLDGPAVKGKIMEYLENAEDCEEFKEGVEAGHIAFIFAFGQGGWSCYGTEEGVQHRIFNILFNALKDGVMTEEQLMKMCAFIISSRRKKKDEVQD